MELSDFLKPFVKESGFVEFGRNDNLAKRTRGVPNEYGAYVIHRDAKDGEIIYIGKAGTIEKDGKYKLVGLRERLNAKQDRTPRKEYFPAQMRKDGISTLFIEWYIIDEEKIIPAFFEALLMQLFYSSNHRLPLWNKTF